MTDQTKIALIGGVDAGADQVEAAQVLETLGEVVIILRECQTGAANAAEDPKEAGARSFRLGRASAFAQSATVVSRAMDRYRRGVAALRPVTVAPEGVRFGIASEAGEAAFLVWEKQFGWCWKSESERQGCITAFVAGWTGHESAALPPASGSDHGPVGWRDMASAPKDGTRILLAGIAHDEAVIGWFYQDRDMDGLRKRWVFSLGSMAPDDWSGAHPVAWQPLPPPPTGDK